MIILSAFLLLISVSYAALLLFYRNAWNRIPSYHSADNSIKISLISVIIPARNEAENLPALIRDLQLQQLPAECFEVLIIDDHSSDSTPEIVKRAGGNIRLVMLADHIVEPVIAYKKKAIETAISIASGNIIVTTDADCRLKPGWLKSIAAYFAAYSCEFLVMPVATTQPKNFFETFQALDFMSLQGITGAALQNKWHYMCNGANLAYLRDTFYKVNGFEGIDKIASGDDMLLMEKVASVNKDGIHYLKSSEVIVETAAAPNIRAFLRQRARWAGKTSHYKNHNTTLVLLFVYVLNAAIVITPLVAFLFRTRLTGSWQFFVISWLLSLTIKTLAEMYFLQPVAKFFNRSAMMKLFPLAQPFHIVYTVFAGFLGMLGKQDWKGRRV